MAKFQYRKLSTDAIRQRATASPGGQSYLKPEFQMFIPKVGVNHIRILPKTWDDDWGYFGLKIWIYWNMPGANGPFVSPSMFDLPNPIDDARREAENDGNEILTNKLSPKGRVLYWVLDRGDKGSGPKVFPCPVSLDREIQTLSVDVRSGDVSKFEDPHKGRDVSFKRSGAGLQTKYNAVRLAKEAEPLSADRKQTDAWIEFIEDNPLTEVMSVKTEQELQDIADAVSA